jgi:hypothetical protein
MLGKWSYVLERNGVLPTKPQDAELSDCSGASFAVYDMGFSQCYSG